MRISAKADYAVRATVELAAAPEGTPVKGDALARSQNIPQKFLENILGELRHAGLVESRRGQEGGYWLARPPADVTVADVMRAVEGPLASVRGEPPERVAYEGADGKPEDDDVGIHRRIAAFFTDEVKKRRRSRVARAAIPGRPWFSGASAACSGTMTACV